MRFFSGKSRPFHLGPYPLERLRRSKSQFNLENAPRDSSLNFGQHASDSIAHAIARFLSMLDTVRDGAVNELTAEIPEDRTERAQHIKAASYFFDASIVGISQIESEHILPLPRRNALIDSLRQELQAAQPVSYAAGIDSTYADILAAAGRDFGTIDGHTHSVVLAVEYTRDPKPNEAGVEWFLGTQAERAALLSANAAVVIASYLRILGYSARAHSATASEVDLTRLALSCGICGVSERLAVNPFVGTRFGLAAVSTSFVMETDRPLDPLAVKSPKSHSRFDDDSAKLFKSREFRLGPHRFETIKRIDRPTTLIDESRVPRFPKRADFFARALFGDLGQPVQEAAKGGHYVVKSPIGGCARRALGALLLLQFGQARGPVADTAQDPMRNADNVKGAAYYLATDAVGISAAPDWVYYSHDAGGNPLDPYHENAVSMLYDQGFDTMEGASGDDWISVAQSMRAYLRFSLIGGVIAEQIRRLGFSARVHSVLDSEVLQPPLLLLSGLGEVSRIGEVILNPFLGPRLKSGVVTTSMPLRYDKPIDFGLQNFCSSCLKCARECPSGAITAGPKLMYNGYEIWKSDAEKCARYRLTNTAGGMCGRCMKTCPWNLEGLFSDAAFRWMAINVPNSARTLAELDDRLGKGEINTVKKWWWDIEMDRKTGRCVKAAETHRRGLNKALNVKYEDQSLAVYPADVMPAPYPVAQPVDRESGIKRYQELLTPAVYAAKLASGDVEQLAPSWEKPTGPPPVFPVQLSKRIDLSDRVALFEFVPLSGATLPEFAAGAHIDVVIAPEYQRQFSLAGNPADRTKYVVYIQRETEGRGGSDLMWRAFREGRRVFISPPRNHFPVCESANFTLLMAGGIGATPLMSMAHRLHVIGRPFLMHCSARSATEFGLSGELQNTNWANNVCFHFSAEGQRADFLQIVPTYRGGFRLYACGSDRYMSDVFAAAEAKGWPDDSLSQEYFSVPETPERENFPFLIELASTGRQVVVDREQSAIEALAEAGFSVDTKCSDGLCGVCAVRYLDGDVDHRDHVLSRQDRTARILLCCSRATEPGGVIKIDL